MTGSQNSIQLVEKKVFHIPTFKTDSGREIRDVTFGYECHGTLNARADNAILVAHYFSGTSHCAGRYALNDAEPGYWDSIIGSGKAIDTDRYFVISVDTLCNLNVGDPRVVTTGPASLNPDTGKPYGLGFPVVGIGDFVEAQRILLDSLGIKTLHAVVGPSMGALQALEWAARYPDRVPRVLAAIGGALATEPYLISVLDTWAAPIRLDPAWRGGDYHESAKPLDGLTQALKLVTLNALHPAWSRKNHPRRPGEDGPSPSDPWTKRFAAEAAIDEIARQRAKVADPNSFLYLCRAVQMFSIRDRAARIRAHVLMIPASSDLLMFPEFAESAAAELRANRVAVDLAVLQGDGGHLDGLHRISAMSETISAFIR